MEQGMQTKTLDFGRPIEVINVVTGEIIPADFWRHQIMHPERYEIAFAGEIWTVGADDIVLRHTNGEGRIAPDYKVRNR
jgi:hypothetical protein